MSGRPEILFPLFADLKTLNGIGPKSAQSFENLAVFKPRDLLFTLPHSLVDRQPKESIRDVTPPTIVTVEVTVGEHVPNTCLLYTSDAADD